MRADAFGFFWQDVQEERKKGEQAPRPIPEIPDNGWKPPKEFPRLEKARLIGLDTETKDLELEEKGPGVRRGAHIAGLSVATDDGHAWYFPMRHEMGENLPPENVMCWAKDELTRPKQPKVGTNLLYDLDFLAEEGVNVAGPFYDIMNAEALLDENANGYSLEAISNRRLKRGKVTEVLEDWASRAYGPRSWKANIYRCPSNLVGPYAEGDALLPIQVHALQMKALAQENLLPLWEVETAQIPLLLAMRRRGVRVSMPKAKIVENRLHIMIAEGDAQIKHAAGFEVNVDEKGHLIRLFENLGLSYLKTAKGNPSFTKEFLEHHPHPVCKMIVAQRKWRKFLGTFVEGYIYKMQINGRIHCLFNQLRGDEYGAISGRYSSSLPNLQNIPIRDPLWGPLIRAIFMPDFGENWGCLDWSQIEYRLLVDRAMHPSAEEARKMYREDPTTDFHQWVSQITDVERAHAKNINFGLVYGMGEETLAAQLGITVEEARPIFNIYHERLPFVKQAREDQTKLANEQGYITTLLGRRRRFNLWEPRYWDESDDSVALPLNEAIAKWGPKVRRAYTHKALNADIQGSAADLMKIAMAQVASRDDISAALGPPLLTVHDELDYSIPKTPEAREAFAEVKNIMETTTKLSIPIMAAAAIARNWGATK
ncbi:MAG: DNA polymerase [Candidatus Binatia bacterium]|nr:DNA polymerase [Candidatus Binatia bacterium]